MAKLPASLVLACFLTFSAGCLGDGSGSASVDVTVPTADADTSGAQEGTGTPETAPAPPKCPKGGMNNYGLSVNANGLYIWSTQTPGFIVYEESNGCSGLQTRQGWAHNPDTLIAETPDPFALKA